MNRLLLACALTLSVPAAFAQEQPAAPAAPEAPAAAPATTPPEATHEELERRIETSVLHLVEKVINAVGDEIPEQEKQEILSDVKSELESERESRSSSADDAQSREELENRVHTGVLRVIDKALSAAGGGVSEKEKQEVLSEIKAELEDRRDSGEHGLSINLDSDSGENIALAIPLLAISLIFGTPILVVAAVLYAGYRKRRLVKETISEYLASGKDVPAEILESIHGGAEKPKNYLQKGFVMVGTGLGIFLCFAIMGEIEVASLGVIPLFIGLAQILIWKLEKPENGPRG